MGNLEPARLAPRRIGTKRSPATRRFTRLEKAQAAMIAVDGGDYRTAFPEMKKKVLDDWADAYFDTGPALIPVEDLRAYIDEIEAENLPTVMRTCRAYRSDKFMTCGKQFDSERGTFHLCPTCRGRGFDRYGL